MSHHSSRKRTEMACSSCRQRKIKVGFFWYECSLSSLTHLSQCESNKPLPCKNCQEKNKNCEYMSVAEDPKAATVSRSSPPAHSTYGTDSSPSYSPANSPPYSPPPGSLSRSYSNGSSSQRVSQPSSNRAYTQSNWPSAQYPSYNQSHLQSPALHEASYNAQPSFPYIETAQNATYPSSTAYSSRSHGMLANGMAMPVSDSPNWHSQAHFTSGTAPYTIQQQQSSQSTSLPGTVSYQGGYPQEQLYVSFVDHIIASVTHC